jgi:hypothetical protein
MMEQVSDHPNFRMNKFWFLETFAKHLFHWRVEDRAVRSYAPALVSIQQLKSDALEALDVQCSLTYRVAYYPWSANVDHLPENLHRHLSGAGAADFGDKILSASKVVDGLDNLRRRDLGTLETTALFTQLSSHAAITTKLLQYVQEGTDMMSQSAYIVH